MNNISAVIVTYNEAHKLAGCLASIRDFADDIVVVDLGSSDRTDLLLKKYKVRKFTHSLVPYADPIRNFAISKAEKKWVLMLDPDERLTPILATRLKAIMKLKDSDYVAVNIPFKNIFFGRWISHTNFWPDKHIRFFIKDKVRWQDMVHSYPIIQGKILDLPAEGSLAIEHYGYDNYSQFVKKQMRYAKSDAWNRIYAGERFSIITLIWKPWREFLVRFIKHQGYKDGIYGVMLVLGLMFYQVLVQFKMLYYIRTKERRPY